MRRCMEYFALRSQFHKVARVHHRDAISYLGHHGEIMRDE
jgi:hypothetical protein